MPKYVDVTSCHEEKSESTHRFIKNVHTHISAKASTALLAGAVASQEQVWRYALTNENHIVAMYAEEANSQVPTCKVDLCHLQLWNKNKNKENNKIVGMQRFRKKHRCDYKCSRSLPGDNHDRRWWSSATGKLITIDYWWHWSSNNRIRGVPCETGNAKIVVWKLPQAVWKPMEGGHITNQSQQRPSESLISDHVTKHIT